MKLCQPSLCRYKTWISFIMNLFLSEDDTKGSLWCRKRPQSTWCAMLPADCPREIRVWKVFFLSISFPQSLSRRHYFWFSRNGASRQRSHEKWCKKPQNRNVHHSFPLFSPFSPHLVARNALECKRGMKRSFFLLAGVSERKRTHKLNSRLRLKKRVQLENGGGIKPK